MTWPFGAIQPFSARVIMADPAWSFSNYSEKGEAKNAKAHYRCMPTDEICALPVGHLASDQCWLWLWATHPMLDAAFTVMSAWGFKFVTSGVWAKRGVSGKLAFGPGYILRTSSEPFLIGKIGAPETFSKSIRTVLEAPRLRHSEKPDLAYKTCETLFGPGPRLDLFSRTSRPGWTNWGDQSTLFDDGATPVTKRERQTPQPEQPAPLPLFDTAA